MHVLITIIGLITAAAVWWYRIKMVHGAARDVAGAAGRARREMERRAAKRRAAKAPLEGIEHPVTAAATILVAVAADEIPLTPRDEKAIRDLLGGVADEETVDGAVDYAKWVGTIVDDPAIVIDGAVPILKSGLTPAQQRDFVDMVEALKSRITYSSRFDTWRDRITDRLDLDRAR